MPSAPDKGEGFIRTHDLLAELMADIQAAYQTIDADKQSQYLRRCVVRAVFSYIEAAVECLKVELRSSVRLGYFPEENLSAKDKETLGSLSIFPDQNGKFLTLDSNIKRTFKLASKIWSLDFKLRTGQDYKDFLSAKYARNKLTHPRTFYDIQVTDEDMEYHTVAAWWVQRELERLINSRIEDLAKTLSGPDRERLLSAISVPHEPKHQD